MLYMRPPVVCPRTLLASALALTALITAPRVQTTQRPSLPSETPAAFRQVIDSFDYVRRVAMIPMRDGVRLHTVILVPKGAKGAPILLTRTPYDAAGLTTRTRSAHLASSLYG